MQSIPDIRAKKSKKNKHKKRATSQSSDVSMQSSSSVKSAENGSTSSMEMLDKISADNDAGLNIDSIIEQLLAVNHKTPGTLVHLELS